VCVCNIIMERALRLGALTSPISDIARSNTRYRNKGGWDDTYSMSCDGRLSSGLEVVR
jgi:hypothetical protein